MTHPLAASPEAVWGLAVTNLKPEFGDKTMNATKDSAHEAMVIELRMDAGLYVAMIKALRRSGRLSGAMLASAVEECATPVSIPEDVTCGFVTHLPQIEN